MAECHGREKNVKLLPQSPSLLSLSLSFSQTLLRQLVDGAKLLEDRQIFHRDIKTKNILIEKGSGVPRVRLIDFGLSCIAKKGSFYSVFYGKCPSFFTESGTFT